MQRYRDYKIRVCGKGSISLNRKNLTKSYSRNIHGLNPNFPSVSIYLLDALVGARTVAPTPGRTWLLENPDSETRTQTGDRREGPGSVLYPTFHGLKKDWERMTISV